MDAQQFVQRWLDRGASLSDVFTALAIEAYEQHRRTGNRHLIDSAVDAKRAVVNMTPEDHPDHASNLNDLGVMLETRYERIGAIADLEEAIQLSRQAIKSMPSADPRRAGCLNNFGSKLLLRYERMGDVGDLEVAITVTRQAVNTTTDDDSSRMARVNNLGNQLELLYQRTGNVVHLEEAIKMMLQGAEKMPEDYPDRGAYLNNLGNKLEHRYGQLGEMDDLEKAIEMARQVAETTSANHVHRAGSLSNLGNKLERRYQRTGRIEDLEEAVEVAYQAVKETPEDHHTRPTLLSSLGTKLECRYQRTGRMEDLEKAIETAQQAVKATSDGHPDLAERLNNFGAKVRRRYERTRDIKDLTAATGAGYLAVKATPDDHVDRAGRLNNLGNAFQNWYERTDIIENLNLAIGITRQAVAATSKGHPSRPSRLSNLGNQLEKRYERIGHIKDLDEAIGVARQAVNATPEGHPDLAGWLNNLGIKLRQRYSQTKDAADLENAITCLERAWHTRTAVPFHRIHAAAGCLKLLSRQRRFDPAIQLGKEVINLLPTVNAKLLDRSDQQYVMSTFAGVAADLCALMLESNQPNEALQYLERGRAVILSYVIDSRNDVSDLARQHPEIARRYEELRKEVTTPLHDLSLEMDALREQVLKRRHEAMADLDACLEEIRAIAGYERFLLGQTVAEMRESAAGGSIVVVNVAELRSDAIIISANAIKAINLPELQAYGAIYWLGNEWTGPRSGRAKRNQQCLEYLAWLWRSAVKQILDEVRAMVNPAGHELLRVWWIGSGLASWMPLHAAGLETVGSTENAYSRAISSYTPSIKALAHARKRAKSMEGTDGPLLLATMETTPAMKSLSGVTEEKEVVLEASKGHVVVESLVQPDVEQVTEGLRRCSAAHFACHGTTDPLDPSNSGLILQKLTKTRGSGEVPEQDRLTMKRISELDLRHARMAYLSACSTAESKAFRLSDEVIHVASGFQAAGFPHVIGCLWPSIDRVCVQVARRFYSSLFGEGMRRWTKGEEAAALREAVMAVKAEDPRMPLNWAQFVHYGP